TRCTWAPRGRPHTRLAPDGCTWAPRGRPHMRLARSVARPTGERPAARAWDNDGMGRTRSGGRGRGGGAEAVAEDVDGGLAQLIPDRDRSRAWTLLIDGAPQSHVDLDDPSYLSFEYQRRFGHVVDLAAPPGRPLRAV